MITVVLVPFDESISLQLHSVSWDNDGGCGKFQQGVKDLIRQKDYLETPLIRPRHTVAGLYAYFNTPGEDIKKETKNVRATRLAMACGLLSLRFFGNILLVRGFGGRWEDLSLESIVGAACISPDLRESIQHQVSSSRGNKEDDAAPAAIPEWLADAAQNNYHDNAALAKVAKAMDAGLQEGDSDEESSDASDENDTAITDTHQAKDSLTEFVAKSPLCLHCRAMASTLCPSCEGAYFCADNNSKSCRTIGWSHSCLCETWNVYTSNRKALSSFPFFGEWQATLTNRQFQTQEEPYGSFLRNRLGIIDDSSWWTTETYGWAGGQSISAKKVDSSKRKTYSEGFSPIVDIPPERRVTPEEERAHQRTNGIGMTVLSSWKDYYTLRGIPATSPVALLCTFPLTVYYSILQFGEVPMTVARMLNRPLRIHLVGAEKEMNFLDLFKEVSYLLPKDIKLELVFVVRQDMLPSSYQQETTKDGNCSLAITLAEALSIHIVAGTYGGILDPRFDCGSGPPDMVLALNAGLYAYESWRSVVTYLYDNPGIVGVFSDYNEYSGVNCAAMGGAKSRESLMMNPFRQPLALPVYSMNLPQFSNGFLYAFNQQELE